MREGERKKTNKEKNSIPSHGSLCTQQIHQIFTPVHRVGGFHADDDLCVVSLLSDSDARHIHHRVQASLCVV